MNKEVVIKKALDLGFDDIGFTSVDPFNSQKDILNSRKEEYNWTFEKGLDLKKGLDPKNVLTNAKSILIWMMIV